MHSFFITKKTSTLGGQFAPNLGGQFGRIFQYNKAIANKISIAPGRTYTLQNQYNNCFKLSFGMPWTGKVENALKLLGKLAKG